jgi:hypothetical protein
LIHVDRKALRQPCNLRRSWQDVASCVYSSRSARHCRSCIVLSVRHFDEQVISTRDLSGHSTETGLTTIYTVNFRPVETRGFTVWVAAGPKRESAILARRRRFARILLQLMFLLLQLRHPSVSCHSALPASRSRALVLSAAAARRRRVQLGRPPSQP